MKDDQGELYYKYNLKMQMLEEKREACEINKKRFEKEREESRMIWNEEKRSLENLTEMWGECEEIGRLRCELGDFINEEQKALSRRGGIKRGAPPCLQNGTGMRRRAPRSRQRLIGGEVLMSGVIMYPQQMKQKTKHMQRQLEKLDLNAANGYQLLGRAGENRLFLMGIAWDSVRSYMSEVQMPLMKTFRLWIEEHKNATAAYEQAVNRLPKVLCLDQDKLEWELEDYIRRLDREYDREHPSSYRIARYRNMIREIRGKLRDMQDFLNATKGLYTEALRLQEILGRADTELKGISSDPETGAVSFSSVNNSWLLEMQNAIGEKYLKDLGISDREIERMKKLGLEAYELKARHECLETEEDRAFFADIINERYLKAFQVNPDKLSLEAKFFLTEYTRMLADKGNIKELEQLINDMLYTDAYHSRYPTGQALDAYGYEYVSILFDITSCLLEEEGKALYAGKNIFTDTGRKKFGSSLKKLADLNALWGAVQRTSYESKYFYESGIESISMRLMYGSKIQNLEHEGSGFEFDTIYSTAWIGDSSYYAAGNNVRGIEWHEGRVLRVSTSVNTSLSSIDSQTYKETIQDLREKKETLWMKYMINTGTGIMGIMCLRQGWYMASSPEPLTETPAKWARNPSGFWRKAE